MRSIARSIGRGLASLFIPPRCPNCDRRVEGLPLPCPSCDRELCSLWDAVSKLPPEPGLLAAFPFEGAARVLIHRMKYEGHRPATELLGWLMAARLLLDLGDDRSVILLPVPLHRTRQRERGFNQAERLARVIGRTAGIAVRADILARVRPSVSLTGLDVEARRSAVTGAFRLRRPTPWASFVLVDDVWTTGATSEACRHILLEQGAPEPLRVLVAARTPARQPARLRN